MDLQKILEEHKKWLKNNSTGQRADLSNRNLSNMDLSGADLRQSIMINTNLSGTNLHKANLSKSVLLGANLYCADVSNADLLWADLRYVDLTGAKLDGIQFNTMTVGLALSCPIEGSCIGYTKVHDNIVVLEIPSDAHRSSDSTFRCRCNKAKVLRIENLDGTLSSVTSLSSGNLVYTVGEVTKSTDYNENRWFLLKNGIMFFISKEMAKVM